MPKVSAPLKRVEELMAEELGLRVVLPRTPDRSINFVVAFE
jgi:hypothetical protein